MPVKSIPFILGSLEQTWKTLETTDSALLETIAREDYDVSPYFLEEQTVPKSPLDKQRTDRLETEKFYLTVSTTNSTTASLSVSSQLSISSFCGVDK